MDFLTLNELMKIPKKGDASKEKKNEYTKNMLTLLAEEGYTATTEKYFFDGFSFCGSFPVFNFLKGLNDTERLDFVTKITKGVMFKNNEKCSSLKVLAHLLSLFIVNLPQDLNITGLLIRCIPHKSKNKTGKINNDFPSIIEKYFISEIDTNTKFPDLQTVLNNREIQTEFALLFTDAIKVIKTKTDKYSVIIESVLNWLNTKQVVISEQTDNKEPQISEEVIGIDSLLRIEKALKKELTGISQIIEYITNLENEISQTKKSKNDILQKLTLSAKEKSILEESNSRLKSSSELLASEKTKLHSELYTLRENFANLEIEHALIKTEYEKQKSVLSVYSSDKQHSLSEQLNIIASKLKTHYLNYKDSLEMEANAELADNLKILMGDIFKTLVRSGVDVVGRITNG